MTLLGTPVPRAFLTILAAASLAACNPPPGPPPRACTPDYARYSCARDDGAQSCAWSRLLERGLASESFERLLATSPDTLDAALVDLFPRLQGRTLVDGEPERHGPVALEYENFDPYPIRFPIDWAADPYGDPSWRLKFQSLAWIDQLEPGAAAHVLVDWVDNALVLDPPLEWTWGDHAMASRFDRVSRFLDRYLEGRQIVHRRVMSAAALVVLTHIHAMVTDACYAPRHNHGVLQDMALLQHLPRYPALAEWGRLWDLAADRLMVQVDSSVTGDGIHTENSPHYHRLYTELVSRAMGFFLDAGEPIPSGLVEVHDQLVENLVYLHQPNRTLPQFGDTTNETRTTRLMSVVAEGRARGVADPQALDQLEWLLTRGERGSPPPALDRVFPEGGYASFRERWTADSFESVVVGHFTCNRHSDVHYHRDETSIEIYGHGTELVLDPGLYSYRHDALSRYQEAAHAHNVLVVDETDYEPAGTPEILGYGSSDELGWVQGHHDHYADLGIESLVRTFAFHRPDAFVVVDHVRAQESHRYDQHFHLHPSLTDIRGVGPGAVIARTGDGDGPALLLASAVETSSVEQARGIQTDERTQGWYFPAFNRADPTTDVVFHYERPGGEHDFPVLLLVFAPSAEPEAVTALDYAESSGELRLSWTQGETTRSVAIPLP